MIAITDSVAQCPFEVTEPMLEYISQVFPDQAPGLLDTHQAMDQAAGMARVTRWFNAVCQYQALPKDSQGHPIEPEPLAGEGLIADLDHL